MATYAFVFADSYVLRVLTLAGTYAILVMGYQFVFGQLGVLSLAQGAFFGIGAYTAALLGLKLGTPYLLNVAAAVIVAVTLAALIAVPVRRLQSHYFALATLGVAEVVLIGVRNWQTLTGGGDGYAQVPGMALFGIAIPRGWGEFAVVWSAAVLLALLAWRLQRGLPARLHALAREDPIAAAAAGIDTGRLRFNAFLWSAGYGAIAGALAVPVVRVISPEVAEFKVMVACLAMTVVGGRTIIAGAFVGALVLYPMPEWFRFLEDHYLIAYGGVLLAAVLLAPDGIAGLAARVLPAPRSPTAPSPTPGSPTPSSRQIPAGDFGAISARPPNGAELEMRGVTKRFGGLTALDGFSLRIEAGEIVGLIGPNGAGKTTLANIITGQYAADSGQVLLNGQPLTGLPAFRIARVGVTRTFQTPALAAGLSALDNVAAAGTDRDGGGPDARLRRAHDIAAACLARVGAAEYETAAVGALPHALRRRVELARALALAPSFIILDEPAAGLTAEDVASLAATLRDLAGTGIGFLVIDHDMDFLLPLAGRLACLHEGRLIASGPAGDVRADPAVIEAYLGPDFGMTSEAGR
ncbi:MAG TPA: branched-chain amino acid ABC transporter ATP-binding protein/permease [Alphaproteobacteria bacterium]|nr:branched-chain amino acid ABC transporter ATP-binding protein/permease [Alphaproteobacteria bacterium]